MDPIADEFAWVSEYNYAENEPVGHIDLWGLQKYKPKMQEIEKPADLVSSKMLNNIWEGTKTVAVEVSSLLDNGFNGLGNLIEGVLPDQGRAESSSFEDENYMHDGSGVEVLSSTELNANGTLALPGAEEGSTAVIDMGEMVLPADAGGIVGDASSNSTRFSRSAYYGGLLLDKMSELNEGQGSVQPVDSICNSCSRNPHGDFSYRRLDREGNVIDTIRPSN